MVIEIVVLPIKNGNFPYVSLPEGIYLLLIYIYSYTWLYMYMIYINIIYP